jgi:Nucleotide modification associated domain 3
VAAFLANVGVNAGHAALSPLRQDGSFVLTPIPERCAWRPPMLRLADVPGAQAHAPRSWAGRAVHLDPDLTSASRTYGDNCRHAGRAYSLRRAAPGDLVVFVARLSPATAPASFHLVGCLDVAGVLEDVARDPGPGWWDANAHVRRARARDEWDGFWVFRGGPRTRLLERAVPFDMHAARQVFGEWEWPAHRSELQTIGSHTRAVRRVEGDGEQWLRTACLS